MKLITEIVHAKLMAQFERLVNYSAGRNSSFSKSKFLKTFVLVFALFIISFNVNSQKTEAGAIKGKILDKATKQSVSFANVIILGTQTGTTSDTSGIFVLKNIGEGIYSLVISFVGYQEKRINDVHVIRGKTNYLEIEIEEAVKGLQEVTVKAYKFENVRIAPISNYGFSREEISRNPGAQGDIFRAIGMLPGVSSSGGQFSAIAVRGQGTRDNVYMVDDIPVVNLGHLDVGAFGFTDPNGARFSIFAPRVIDNAQFQGGGFAAQYGRRSASYLGLGIKEGNKEDFVVDGQLDLIGATINYDGPSYIHKNTSIFLSGRYQNFGPVMKMVGVDYMGKPEFGDFIFKSTTELGTKNKLSVVAIISPEKMTTDTNNIRKDKDLNAPFTIEYHANNNIFGINLRTLTGSRSYWRNIIYYTRLENNYSVGKCFPQIEIDNNLISLPTENGLRKSDYKESKIGYRSVYNVSFTNKSKLTFGLDIDRVDVEKHMKLSRPDTLFIFNTSDFRPNPSQYYSIIDPQFINTTYSNFSYNASAYFDYSFVLFKKLNVNAGVRQDYTGFADQFTFSPRLSGSYELNEGNSITFATGILYQDPIYSEVADQTKDKRLKEEKITQFILGYKKYFTPDLKLTVEGWYKQFDNMVVRPFAFYNEQNNSGIGWASGFDVNLTKRLTSKVHGQIGYSYMQSKRNNNDGLGEYNFTFSQPHQVNLLCSYKANEHWILSTKFRYATGKPTDSYVIHTNVFSNPNFIRNSMEITNTNQKRLPDFISLDVRADYSFKINGINLIAFVDIVDILNRMNPNQVYFNPISGKTYYDGLSIFPTFGLKFEL